MHAEALDFVQTAVRRYHGPFARPRVVEFGSRDVNGGLRHLFPRARCWIGVDATEGPGVDVVADASEWGSAERYDLVLCAEVFEHTPRWSGICATAMRVMAEGGAFVATCATDPRAKHGAHDPDGSVGLLPGEFYENVHPGELARCLQGLGFARAELTMNWVRGDLYAVATR